MKNPCLTRKDSKKIYYHHNGCTVTLLKDMCLSCLFTSSILTSRYPRFHLKRTSFAGNGCPLCHASSGIPPCSPTGRSVVQDDRTLRARI